MNWFFWILLILGIVLLLAPIFVIFEAALAVTIWLIGGVLLIGTAIWVVIVLARGTAVGPS